jgi:ABC-type multidrug transport system fused ATPase/permease subunit
VLQQGRIVERGTHEQLMSDQSAYAKLVAQE